MFGVGPYIGIAMVWYGMVLVSVGVNESTTAGRANDTTVSGSEFLKNANTCSGAGGQVSQS